MRKSDLIANMKTDYSTNPLITNKETAYSMNANNVYEEINEIECNTIDMTIDNCIENIPIGNQLFIFLFIYKNNNIYNVYRNVSL